MAWTLRVERTVPFPREAVYAWWTDFREDDHRGPDAPATSTRLVLPREGRDVWLRDVATRPARVTVDAHVVLDPPHGYRVRARYPLADADYAYRFEPVPEGTRILLTGTILPRHVGRILVPLSAPWWRGYAARDLDFHLREMVGDLGP
jgi:hypothetical protein